ncbi:putative membrane protein [Tamaricihabitans halophyticus]|uniref:Putative membrane protein n=1 Tax=Tamaricihabitans halophyticus TaxID=1262583 RepID=A0A4R2QBD8_9PSEU|nr:putative membrane protein [Tamaricihabitans halophyticus]
MPSGQPGRPGRAGQVRQPPGQPAKRHPEGRRRAQGASQSGGTRRASKATPELASGHGHGHGPQPRSSRNVRRLLANLLIPFAFAAIAGTVVLFPWGTSSPESAINQGTPVNGTVTEAAAGSCLPPGQVRVGEASQDDRQCLDLRVELTDGPAAGKTISQSLPIEPSTVRFAVGDEVVLSYAGADPEEGQSYRIMDFQRGIPLTVLAVLFAGAVVLLGRWQGMYALISLALSFLVLAFFALPAILVGEDPLLVAIVASGLIMFVTLYLTHGFSARTSTAVLGTMISLCLIGVLAAIFAAFSKLTGLDEETASLIGALGQGIDARGLLLAGVVIGALGVLDDVTVSQASSVWELRRANPKLSWRQLYAAGLRIGRDHAASAVNTLFMAYAGAALPILLYSYLSGVGLGSILGSQNIAQEIVRTLAGSIGLIAAIPLTTALAAIVASKEPVPEQPADEAQSDDTSSGEDSAESQEEGGTAQSHRPAK